MPDYSMSEASMSPVALNREHIAVNRFGYGARGNELSNAKPNPKQWIISQLLPVSFDTSLPNSNDVFIAHAKFVKYKKQRKMQAKKADPAQAQNKDKAAYKQIRNYGRNTLRDLSADTLNQAITSSHSVSWRLLDFFSNHFSVSGNGVLMTGLSAT